jgi:hypothetical protein
VCHQVAGISLCPTPHRIGNYVKNIYHDKNFLLEQVFKSNLEKRQKKFFAEDTTKFSNGKKYPNFFKQCRI